MISPSRIHDLLIVGGGINGAGIAADAAGRGLDVLLCEMDDLAGATSSASTKLIHGGLRYLEYREFRLVRESLAEREVLLRKAPHIIQPLRFRLPLGPRGRPRWMLRAGLWLYDRLGGEQSLPRSRAIALGPDSPLRPEFSRGFEYYDAQVDDARLVVLNAMQAREHGATVLTRTRCVALRPEDGLWHADLRDCRDGSRREVRARALVNAAGPWVDELAGQTLPADERRPLRLVKGCHIVVPRLYPGPEAYLLQGIDGRVVFVIPWENDFSLIGTTEVDYAGDPRAAVISEWEIRYLLEAVNAWFRASIEADAVLHHFAGVRPLTGSMEEAASRVSRDYVLDMAASPAPVLTVYGGKITTYRRLAEAALRLLEDVFPTLGTPWTRGAALPGGDFASRTALAQDLRGALPWLPEEVRARWLRQYGSLARDVAGDATCLEALGRHFGHGLYAREVDYLAAREWARCAEDVLWRRTRLGLRFSREQAQALDAYLGKC